MALSTETKVGIFFILGLVLLGIITFKVENWSALFVRKHHYYIQLPSASGLAPGGTVAIAGLKVGEIKQIDLLPTGVRMTLSIEARYQVYNGAKATVAWAGLLGTRYVDISLGSISAGVMPPGSEIPTEPSLELTEIFARVQAAAAGLQEVGAKVQELLKNTDFGPKLTKVIDDIAKIADDVSSHRGTLGKLIGDDALYQKVTAIADDLKDLSARLSRLVATNDKRFTSILENIDTTVPEVRDAFAAVKRVAEQIDTGKGLLPALLRDDQMYADLRNALKQISAAADRIDAVATSMQEGKGLIGKLSNDPQLAADFGETIRNIRIITQRLESGDSTVARLIRDKDLYQDIKKVVDDARETLRSAREQIPVGTFASVLLNAF